MSNNETAISVEFPEEDRNLLSSGVRIFSLLCMGIIVCCAFFLGAWVLWYRKAPAVVQMQPIFLMMLITGVTVQSLSIMPSGADEENTENVNAACLSYYWLISLGSTLTLSALFSKLWRVNRLFNVQGFQRKVVTVKDVLKPFLALFGLNLVFLIILTTMDPPVWHREPIDDLNPYSTYGVCQPGTLGSFMVLGLATTDLVATIFLCIQAYRARDIRSDFSEARGVALALFSSLQAIIITTPAEAMLDQSEVDAKYMLQTMSLFVSSMAMLLFIFGPLIAHHRAYVKRDSTVGNTRTHISGLDCCDTPSTIPARSSDSAHQEHCSWKDEEDPVSSLELELGKLRSRLAELEGSAEVEVTETETTA